MIKLLTTCLTGCGIMLSLICYGQYPTDVPLGSLPMLYNPSFAGQAGSARFSTNINYELAGDYYGRLRGFGTIASYDQFIPAIRSGIGITARYADFSSRPSGTRYYYNGAYLNKFNSEGLSISVAFAPKISLKGKYTISPSIDFTYGMGDYKSTFNQVTGIDSMYNINNYGLNSRAGILFNTNKLYVGYTVNVLRRSIRNSQINPVNNGPKGWFESYLQAGYTFQKNSNSKFSFTPQVVIEIGKNDFEKRIFYGLAGYNFNLRYKQFIWGVNDGGVFSENRSDSQLLNKGGIHVGWQTDRFRVMLTNSYSNVRYIQQKYTGNLSLRYILGNKDQKPGRGW